MADTSPLVRVSLRGVANAERKLDATQANLNRFLQEGLSDLADALQGLYRARAPKGRGRLAAGLLIVSSGSVARPGFMLVSTAVDETSGFDYLPVTRFGHRVDRIYPRGDRSGSSVIATSTTRLRGGRAALRLDFGGRVLFRRSVKGYHPAGDWVSEAHDASKPLIREAGTRLGRRVTSSLQ